MITRTDLLTVDELSRKTRCRPHYIRRLVKRRLLRAIALDGVLAFDVSYARRVMPLIRIRHRLWHRRDH